MIRSVLVATLTLVSVLTGSLSSAAQPTSKAVRIAMVCGVSCDGPSSDAFWQALRELGYVEGRNLVRDMRGADGQPERPPSILAEVLAARPDVIVPFGPQPTRAAKAATSTVPTGLPESSTAARHKPRA